MIEPAEYLKLLIALLAIIDIPGNLPFFMQQTGSFNRSQRLTCAMVAAVATCAILLTFALVGELVLSTFGITIAAFKVLGGLVVLLIALDMLGLLREDEPARDIDRENANPVSIGVFPLAIPLFAGPGAITAVMVYGHEEFHSNHDVIMIAVIVSACVVLLAGLLLANTLNRLITPLVQIVLNRLLGMIVGALGVEFILEGFAEFFPALAN
ncbi:MAG: MarC family protein [Pseudomonadota bacterium]